MFGLSELAVVLVVAIAVIGARKLPELTRSAGRSARILKAEARAAREPETGAAPRVIKGETVAPGTRPGAPSGTSAATDGP
ncbi:twin-arginine translocase TatA/TatE family subunit [Streptomyces sp. NPDC001595]|uniref:twin-arginine translocase TatA/TatE family subunit n=1 Tax=Streptomyces sp. NPDC001532 TaxID=3154520 RepID=UPI00332392AC